MTKIEMYKKYKEYFLHNDDREFWCGRIAGDFHCSVCPWIGNSNRKVSCTSIAYNDYMKHTKTLKLLEILK